MRTLVAFAMGLAVATALAVRSQPTPSPDLFVHKAPRRHTTNTTPFAVGESEEEPREEDVAFKAVNSSSASVSLVDLDEETRDDQAREEDKSLERRKRSIVDFDGNSLALKTVDSKSLMPEGEPLSMRVADDRATKGKGKREEKSNGKNEERDKEEESKEEEEDEREEDSDEDDIQEKRRGKRDVTQESLVQRLLEAFEPMLLSSENDPEFSSNEPSFRRKRSIVTQDESSRARELDLTQPLEIDFPASDRVEAKKVKVDLVPQQHGHRKQLKDDDQLTREDIRELASRTDLSEILSWLEALSEGREQDVAAALLTAKAKWRTSNATNQNPEAEATKQEWKVSKIMTDDTAKTKDIAEQHKKNKVDLVDPKAEELEPSDSLVSTSPPEIEPSETPPREGKKQRRRRRRRRRKLQSNATQKANNEATDANIK